MPSDLIKQALDERGGAYRAVQGHDQGRPLVTAPKIHDLGKLVTLMESIFEEVKVQGDERERCAGFRKVIRLWEAPIVGYVGHVDDPTWRYIVNAAIKGKITNHTASQSNGRWVLYDAAVEVTTKRHVDVVETKVHPQTGAILDVVEHVEDREYFRVAFQLVDTLGQRDMEYVLGRVVSGRPRSDLDGDIGVAILEMLKAQGHDKSADDAQEKIARLEAQVEALAKLIKDGGKK